MKLQFQKRRWAATLMLGLIAATSVVPAAEAGVGHYRRWKPGPSVGYVREGYPVRVYERSSSGSGVAPFLFGLVGGVILGSALSNSAHASYYDPYCETSFNSLDACRSHFRGCGHPEVIRVVEGGRYTRDMCWSQGAWHDYRGSFGGSFTYRSGGDRRYGGGGEWRGGDRRYGGGDQWRDRDGRWNRGEDRWGDRDGRYDGRDRRDDSRWNDREQRNDDRWQNRRGDDDRWNRDDREDDDDEDDE